MISHSEIIATAIFPWVMDEERCGYKMKGAYVPCCDDCACMEEAREAGEAAVKKLADINGDQR